MSRFFVNKTIKFSVIDFVFEFFKQFWIVMKIIELIIIARCRVVIIMIKFII